MLDEENKRERGDRLSCLRESESRPALLGRSKASELKTNVGMERRERKKGIPACRWETLVLNKVDCQECSINHPLHSPFSPCGGCWAFRDPHHLEGLGRERQGKGSTRENNARGVDAWRRPLEDLGHAQTAPDYCIGTKGLGQK